MVRGDPPDEPILCSQSSTETVLMLDEEHEERDLEGVVSRGTLDYIYRR
jgi:hypothetical protein